MAAGFGRVGQEGQPAPGKLKLQEGEELDQAKGEEHDGEGEQAVGELVHGLRLLQGRENPVEGEADCGKLEESKADDGLKADQELEVPSEVNLNKVLAVVNGFWWTGTLFA